MKTWDGIDAILLYSNEFSNDAATLYSSASQVRIHRDRLWLRWQQTVDEFWQGWEWPFRYSIGTSATLTSATATCDAPSDFHIGGYEASVWIPAQNREIVYLSLHRLLELRRTLGSGATGIPSYYSVADTTSAGVPKLLFDLTADSTYTLAIDYERRPPQLMDKAPAVTTAAGAAGNVTGTVLYKLTLVNADGETDGGAASTSLTVSSKIVTITNIYVPPGFSNVTAKKLYRSSDGGSTYNLVASIPLADTTYSDNIASGSLGAALSTTFSGLEKIPVEYHALLLEGVLVLDQRDHGDTRSATESEGRWRKNLARAKATTEPGAERFRTRGEAGLSQFRMH